MTLQQMHTSVRVHTSTPKMLLLMLLSVFTLHYNIPVLEPRRFLLRQWHLQDTLQSYSVTLNVCYTWPASATQQIVTNSCQMQVKKQSTLTEHTSNSSWCCRWTEVVHSHQIESQWDMEARDNVRCRKVWLTPTTGVPCSNAAKIRNPVEISCGAPNYRWSPCRI